ncbi:MAG: FAD-dependent oxidoreductase, partial [Proteobacteria bacterium]|nr:FAD-dependent oxidoreductase [Pseudomonadota bacterium]
AEFIKHWSGLRPATDSGKPYLGQLKDYENVYINAGHFRKGILQAPVCARIIAEMVC